MNESEERLWRFMRFWGCDFNSEDWNHETVVSVVLRLSKSEKGDSESHLSKPINLMILDLLISIPFRITENISFLLKVSFLLKKIYF